MRKFESRSEAEAIYNLIEGYRDGYRWYSYCTYLTNEEHKEQMKKSYSEDDYGLSYENWVDRICTHKQISEDLNIVYNRDWLSYNEEEKVKELGFPIKPNQIAQKEFNSFKAGIRALVDISESISQCLYVTIVCSCHKEQTTAEREKEILKLNKAKVTNILQGNLSSSYDCHISELTDSSLTYHTSGGLTFGWKQDVNQKKYRFWLQHPNGYFRENSRLAHDAQQFGWDIIAID